jgi:hypothetical protein
MTVEATHPLARRAGRPRERARLIPRAIEITDVQVLPWSSFVFFSDLNGNRFAVQQLPPRD